MYLKLCHTKTGPYDTFQINLENFLSLRRKKHNEKFIFGQNEVIK